MNNYNNNMICNCDNERIEGDVLEIVSECVCDNGLEYLRNILCCDDVMDIIMADKFDMEYEDRVKAHREIFEDTLNYIVSRRWRGREADLYNEFESNIGYELSYMKIGVEYDGENMMLMNNDNDWNGFDSRDLLYDLMVNYFILIDAEYDDYFNEYYEDRFDDMEYDEAEEEKQRIWSNLLKIEEIVDNMFMAEGVCGEDDRLELYYWICDNI